MNNRSASTQREARLGIFKEDLMDEKSCESDQC